MISNLEVERKRGYIVRSENFDDDFAASRTGKSGASDVSNSARGSTALLKTVVELVACSAAVVSLLLLQNFMGATSASSSLHLPEWTSNSDEVA